MRRRNHGASPLTYSPTLASYAESLTDSCSSISRITGPSSNTTYSTNTFAYYSTNNHDQSCASEQTARAISTWYNDELYTYAVNSADFSTNPINYDGLLHFSQMVWKDTTEVGCSATRCDEGTGLNADVVWPVAWAVVCAYNPAGNCVGNACPDHGFLGNVGQTQGMSYLGYKAFAACMDE